MAVLDSDQFNRMVQEVREALLAGSQGVGEVEVVKSLENLVSLPALRLIGQAETVVEAPLELLSLPAVEAAADARKATGDAIVAAVNASAAADLAEAGRNDLEDLKEQAVKAGAGASAQGDKAFAGAMNADNATLHAMQVASFLQAKLEQAQVVILSGKAMQDVIGALDCQVRDSITVCVDTREEAYAAILRLRGLQKQVAQAIADAYAFYDLMGLSIADARQAAMAACKAMERTRELSERTGQVLVESVVQTGEARLATLRLEILEQDLLSSKSFADTAARLAYEQAGRAMQSAGESERLNADSLLLHERLDTLARAVEKASGDAKSSAAGADTAAALAREKAGKAEDAAVETLKTKSGADIAAARALAAEQRAIDAAKTAENIVSGIRPDYNEPDKTNSNYIANKPETPTLEAAPTADTLAYVNRDGNEVAFRVGDEARVLEDEEYIFYKLYDLAEGKAVWDIVGGGNNLPSDILLSSPSTFSSDEELIFLNNGVLN